MAIELYIYLNCVVLNLRYEFKCLRHIVLQSQSVTGTYFSCFAKKSKQKKATRARIGPRCPRSVVSQTIQLFVSLPHSVRLDGIFKSQLNVSGTALTLNLNIIKMTEKSLNRRQFTQKISPCEINGLVHRRVKSQTADSTQMQCLF